MPGDDRPADAAALVAGEVYSRSMIAGAPVREAGPAERRGHAAGDGQGPLDYEHRYTGRGPKGRLISGVMGEYGADPVGAMRRWRDDHGDFVPIRFGPFRAHVAFGPNEIEE